MSERKSAEIKFRCTPSFKAGVQASAEAAGRSMSEYIETAVWAHQNAKLDGTALVNNAIAELRGLPAEVEPPYVEHLVSLVQSEQIAAELEDDESPVDDDPATWCLCRPWEFCTHKADA